ncbi:MAG: ATPase domain-containing protein [Candidatus Korarchaeum sp.]
MSLDELSGRIDKRYIEMMRKRGIGIEDLTLMTDSELAGKLGVDRDVAREILREVSLLSFKPVTAEELLPEGPLLRTGMRGLDELLGGGIRLRTITGIYGPPSSGKTQFCIYITTRSLMELEEGGISSRIACFIDTEGTFDPRRAVAFLKQNGLPEDHLSRIRVMKAYNTQQLHLALELSAELVRSGESEFLCLDSISHPLSSYEGLRGLKEKQEELQKVLMALRRIAERGSIVIMTMHAVRWGRGLHSKGGFVLAHVPHNMLCFRRIRGDRVVVTLEDSSYLPPGQAAFRIGEDGLFEL